MTTLVVYSASAGDGYIWTGDGWDDPDFGYPGYWTVVRAGTGSEGIAAYTSEVISGPGTSWGGTYANAGTAQEDFLSFDTSAVGSGVTVSAAVLTLTSQGKMGSGVVRYRLRDWGTTLEIADWVAGASLSGLPLLAHYDMSSPWVSGTAYDLASDTLAAYVNKTGTTRMVGHIADLESSTPTAGTRTFYHYGGAQTGTSQDPKLTVTYSAGGAYPAAVLADSPVAYWRLGDASGPAVSAVVGPVLTAYDNPTFGADGLLTGDSDKAMSFDPASYQYIQGPDTGLPTGNGPWSAEAWVKTSSSSEQNLVAWGTAGSYRDICLTVFNGNYMVATSDLYSNFGGSVADGSRHHLVLTWDGTTMRGYIDGSQSGSGYTPGALNLTLGGSGGCTLAVRGYYLNGTLDEVAIYPSCLSAERIAAHYAAGTGSGEEPPAGQPFIAVLTKAAL